MAGDPARADQARSAVLGVALLNGLGYGIIFPVAALYGEHAGLSPATITALIALHPLMRLLSGPVWGRLADRLGRRPVLLAGIALQAVGHLIFGLAGGPLGLGLGRLLTGLGSGEAVATLAVVADLTAPEDRAVGLGQLRAAVGLGMLMGPLLGGGLGLVSLSLPGFAAAFISGLSFAAVYARLPETRPERPAEAAAPGPSVPAILMWTAGTAAAALALAESIVPLAVEHVLVPTLARSPSPEAAFWLAWVADWTDPQLALLLTVGVILAWGMTTVLFDGFLSAKIVNRVGARAAILGGLSLWTLAFALTPPVYRLGVLPGGLAVAATAIPVSLTGVGLQTWLSRWAGPDAQGRVGGAALAAVAFGEFLGPATSGWLYAHSYGLPYQVGALILGLTALGSGILIPHFQTRRESDAR